jgi:hypothetical protein
MRRFQSALELSDALAYACGISVKRAPPSGVPSGSTQPSMHGPPIMTPHSGQMTPYGAVPNVTSAPFTSPNIPPVKTSNAGMWIAAIMGGLTLGVGAIAIAYYLHNRTPTAQATVPASTPTPTAVVTAPIATQTTPSQPDPLPTLTPTATNHVGTNPTTRPTVKTTGTTTATTKTTGTTTTTAPTVTTKTTTTTTQTAPTTTKPGGGGDCNGCGF